MSTTIRPRNPPEPAPRPEIVRVRVPQRSPGSGAAGDQDRLAREMIRSPI